MRKLSRRLDATLDVLWPDRAFKAALKVPGSTVLKHHEDLEMAVRQLVRTKVLETQMVESRHGGSVLLPTLAEVVRIRAFLLLTQNRAEDYLALARLGARFGVEFVGEALSGIEDWYADPTKPAADMVVRSQLVTQLGLPKPTDSYPIRLLRANWSVFEPWRDWGNITAVCAALAGELIQRGAGGATTLRFRNVVATPADPVTQWGTEGFLSAIERGWLPDWHRIATAIAAEPFSETTSDLQKAIMCSRPSGQGVALARLFLQVRQPEEARKEQAKTLLLGIDGGRSWCQLADQLHISCMALDAVAAGIKPVDEELLDRLTRTLDGWHAYHRLLARHPDPGALASEHATAQEETEAGYRARLLAVARANHAVVTTAMAKQAGIAAWKLHWMGWRDKEIDHFRQGIYEFWHEEFEDVDVLLRQAAVGIALGGPGSYLWGEAVLEFFELALVCQTQLTVAIPEYADPVRKWGYRLEHRETPAEDLTAYRGIPMTTVARAFLDTPPERYRLLDALDDAEGRGLITKTERTQIEQREGFSQHPV